MEIRDKWIYVLDGLAAPAQKPAAVSLLQRPPASAGVIPKASTAAAMERIWSFVILLVISI